jgi:serine/threonine-protein kinase RsbW
VGGLEPTRAKVERDPVSAGGKGRWSFRLNSTMESVGEVEATAERLATEAGFDEDETFHIAMAVREATVNAVLHGNEYDSSRPINVVFENSGTDFIFTIADQGQGFDPDRLPDPSAPENLLRGTGRGIFLIRSLMDEVHFRQLYPGTELTLVKHLAHTAGKS